MAEETFEGETGSGGDQPPEPDSGRAVLDMPSWLPRWVLMAAAAVAIVGLIVGTTVPFAVGWLDKEDLETLGLPGIFLANFLGTATVFVPVPGLTAAAQVLIVAGPRELGLNPVAVVVAGASAMTLAESTAYLAGAVGRGVAEERQMPLRGRAGRWLRKMAGWVDRLMAHYGFATLLVLSAVPNPAFEFAGVTAGVVRMNFWRFLLAVGIGKTIRVILLVIVGDALLDLFEL